MIPKSGSEITESDLQGLVDARATEGRTLEFKRELPGPSDQGKVAFLRSITALANTAGGDLVYGMETTDGVATAVVPLAMPSRDDVVLRLESLCAGGVDPRLGGVQFHWVALAQGGDALVVRCPHSWNAPHRVTAGGHAQFYGRHSAGVYPMDVGQLRRAFGLATAVAERIRGFRTERLMAIAAGQGPVALHDGAIGVLHVLPIQAFTSDLSIDVVTDTPALNRIGPIGAGGWNPRLNLDGRLTTRPIQSGRCHGYTQLFRSGVIEATVVYVPREGHHSIPSQAYEADMLRSLTAYFKALPELGVAAPAYVTFSLLRVRGFRLGVSRERFFSDEHFEADREALNLPEVQVADWGEQPAAVMRPLFDSVWNAFGLARSFNYDDKGNWVG
jgi:hypothetical protein